MSSIVSDVIAKPKPGVQPGRIGLWALILGFGGFVLWAALAPLDEGVPGQGMVTIDTKSRAVQHISGGIIKEVLVKEGQQVKEGQLLIKLDEAVAKANFESSRQRYLGLRAMQGRLLAEQQGLGQISWHADLREAMSDPQIRQMTLTQEQLFGSRRAGLRADLSSIDESIAGQEGLLQAYTAMMGNRRNQLALLSEEHKNTSSLVAEGYAPRNRQLELERMLAESNSSIAELLGNTTRAQRAVGELRQRAVVRQQEYRKEVESQLSEVDREVQADAEKFRATRDDLARTEIKSPAAGQVNGLAFQSVGGVIGPGQKLMDIVPVSQTLLLEARVSPHLIDRVHADLPVDVRFSSFANSPQLVVEGKVVSISADLLVDQHTGAGYFLARVAVTPEGMKKLGKRQMQAGMPVEVIFITGERSMLTYLLHPLTKRMAASMKEE
ncbi:MAG: HlyD family type I secretion periplasmic adaptor subunit [Burkholderiales bacterium]|nr:HlyD family type I secretion periplasmic adaptor subunit [Burkholderiales bacterium]